MAYVTGAANSISDFLSAIQTACVNNGWTLSGNVLHKNGCYVELKLDGNNHINLMGGTGVDGSNALTGVATNVGTIQGIGYSMYCGNDAGTAYVQTTFGWPITYFIHIFSNPDEVYVIANYATIFYQQLSFGKSTMPGLMGTGNWFSGSYGYETSSNYPYGGAEANGEYGYSYYGATSIFCRYFDSLLNGGGQHHAGVDNQFETNGWMVADAVFDAMNLLLKQPNQWNDESILVPIRVYAFRPSNYLSPVLECANARYVHLANLTDQQVITIGTDKWKVYPWFKRGVRGFNTNYKDGSLLYGHAIRYDGP